MGRFDALTHLEDTKEQPKPSQVVSPPAQKPPTTPETKLRNDVAQKPEIMISRNHENISPHKEKPLKYSTLLDAGLIKKIRIVAAEKEIRDYEVIEEALTEYFTRNH